MEEKYRKLAVDLGIKREDDCEIENSVKMPNMMREREDKYYENKSNELELKIKLLTDVIAEQREYTNILEQEKADLEAKVIDLSNEIDNRDYKIAKRDEEIETLKKIIDKCNTTYYNANTKTQVVLDGTVKAVEECVKQRSKKDGND